MKFSPAKRLIKEKLTSGEIQHEARKEIDKKNKLSTGELTPDEVNKLLDRATFNDFDTSPHDKDASITVYIFRPLVDGTRWYIKAYFIEPDVWFISVHK